MAKSPRVSLSPSAGPMNKYVTQGGDREGECLKAEKQQSTKGRQMETREGKEKIGQNKTLLEISTLSESRVEQVLKLDFGARKEEEQLQTAQLPTKTDMEAMFAALENSLKTEMAIIHKDLGHMLSRVEEVEKMDSHTSIIKELKGEMNILKKDQQEQAYRIEDQKKKG